MMRLKYTYAVTFSILLFMLQTGCGIFIGNVKPVEEKSEFYGVTDLSKSNSGWTKLSPATTNPAKDSETTQTEIPDVTFQSQKTASIISLDSGCRPSYETGNTSLQEFTNQLLMGFTEVTRREEINTDVQNTPALQTTVQGTMNSEDVIIRTVVLRRKSCVYDLTYVARPKYFKEDEQEFSHFVASLRLK